MAGVGKWGKPYGPGVLGTFSDQGKGDAEMRIVLVALLLGLAGCNDASKPSVLVIGDSTSIGWTPYVQQFYPNVEHNGKCFKQPFIHTSGADDNAEWSAHEAACIDMWLSRGHYDIVHFNAGLWDLLECGEHGVTPLSDYLNNLQIVLDAIRKYGAYPIFATTTPVIRGNDQCVDPRRVREYNAAAMTMMISQGVQVDDLYSLMQPVQHQYHYPHNIHFDAAGYMLLASGVMTALSMAISQN